MDAVLYLRISQDRTGEQEGIERQREECRRLAKKRGWKVVHEYVDNDLSAYDRRKRRPAWEQLLTDARAGRISAVVAWHTKRLCRRLDDTVRLMRVAQEHKIAIATVTSGDLDVTSAAGRMVVGVLASVAENESAEMSERLQAQRSQAAKQGKWNGGPRVYGYTANMSSLVTDEAVVIREVADRLLAGDSLRAVTSDLNRRGVPTARGGTWRTSTVRQLITAARLSGQREHTPGGGTERRLRGYGLGEIVASGHWPAILTTDETERLRALLSDPRRRTYRPSTRLLTGGVVRCGRCGGPMNSRTVSGHPEGWRYACIRHVGTNKCGGMSVVGTPLDSYIEDMVLGLVANGISRSAPKQSPTPSLWRDLAAAEERLAEMASMYAAGELEKIEWMAARRAVEAKMADLRAQTAGVTVDPLAGLPRSTRALQTEWSTMHVDRKRAIVACVVDRVIINPAAQRGRPRFDPERVQIDWLA